MGVTVRAALGCCTSPPPLISAPVHDSKPLETSSSSTITVLTRYRTKEQIYELFTDAGLPNLLAAFFFDDCDSEDDLHTDEEFSEDKDFSVAELL